MAELSEQDTNGFVLISKLEDGTYQVVEAGLTREETYFAVMAAYSRERLRMMNMWMPEPAKEQPAEREA